ncbi:DNA-binding protein [Serratia marcescens]|nr:DNA-binding protein [Serratia marcescens]
MRCIRPGNMAVKRHKLYTEIAENIKYLFDKKDLPKELSNDFAEDVVDFIAAHFGGQNITFPADVKHITDLRNINIYNDFMESGNYSALAEKYGFTERGIRKVIEQVKNKLRTERLSEKE